MPYWGMAELVFEVVQEADGCYCAECLTENIFTEGDTWQQLRENVLEATARRLPPGKLPPVRLLYGAMRPASRVGKPCSPAPALRSVREAEAAL